MKKICRDSDQDRLVWYKDHKIIRVKKRNFLKKHQVADVIRLRPEEYAALNRKTRRLTLFNVQHTSHLPGKRYFLTLIVRPGYYNGTEEVLPVLSLDKLQVVECISARNNLQYSNLSRNDFAYSLKTIQNVSELQQAIIKKYSQSLPGLSAEELLRLGIAVTNLKFVPEN